MPKLTAADHARLTDAVNLAEGGTSGEIVTIVADRSDGYRDIALICTGLAALFIPVLFAVAPAIPFWLVAHIFGGWGETEVRDLSLVIFGSMAIVSAAVFALLTWEPLRLRLAPRATRRYRVRSRAIELFKVGAQGRTTGRTGILIYLSLGEHMAEIVADEAIHAKVSAEAWGDAMIALTSEASRGRIVDGMIAAVAKVGEILAVHLPRADDDRNELPDRLIEL